MHRKNFIFTHTNTAAQREMWINHIQTRHRKNFLFCLLLFLHVVVGRRRPSMFFCVDSFFQPWYSCCLYNSPVDVMRYIFFIISFKVHIGKIQQFSTNIDIHLYRELKRVVWEWVYFWYAWTIFSVWVFHPLCHVFFCLIHIFLPSHYFCLILKVFDEMIFNVNPFKYWFGSVLEFLSNQTVVMWSNSFRNPFVV